MAPGRMVFGKEVPGIRVFWKNGIWTKGTWKSGDWYNGFWEDGAWENGFWENGVWEKGVCHSGTFLDGVWREEPWGGAETKNGFFLHLGAVANTTIYFTANNQIKIGRQTKTREQWDEWFAGDKEFETPSDSEEFNRFYAGYKAFIAYNDAIEQQSK